MLTKQNYNTNLNYDMINCAVLKHTRDRPNNIGWLRFGCKLIFYFHNTKQVSSYQFGPGRQFAAHRDSCVCISPVLSGVGSASCKTGPHCIASHWRKRERGRERERVCKSDRQVALHLLLIITFGQRKWPSLSYGMYLLKQKHH